MRSQVWSLAAREAAKRPIPHRRIFVARRAFGSQASDSHYGQASYEARHFHPKEHFDRSAASSSADTSVNRGRENRRQVSVATTSDHALRLLKFLRSNLPPSRFHLPAETTPLDAYLFLQQSSAKRVADLDEESIGKLCSSVAREELSEVIEMLLDDLVGSLSSSQDDFPDGDDHSISASPSSAPRQDSFDNVCQKILSSVALHAPAAPRRRQSVQYDPFVERLRWCSRLSDVFEILVERGGNALVMLKGIDASTCRKILGAIIHSTEDIGSPHLLACLFQRLIEDDSATSAPSGQGEQGPFPMAIEGARLIDYLLDLPRSTEGFDAMLGDTTSSLQLPQSVVAAAKVLEEAKAAGTEAASDELVSLASSDGRRISELLSSMGREQEVAEAALEMTLRSVALRLFQKAARHQSASETLKGITKFVESLELPPQDSNEIVGSLSRSLLTTILASQSHKAFQHAACDIIKNTSHVLFAPEQLAHNLWLNQFYELAFSDKHLLRIATDVMAEVVASSPCAQYQPFALAATLGPRMIIAVLKRYAPSLSRVRVRRRLSVDFFVKQFGIFDQKGCLVADREELGRAFPPGYRAPLVAILADVGLKKQALQLYFLWGDAAAEPNKNLMYEENIDRLTDTILFDVRVSPKRRREENIHKVSVEPSTDDSLEVVQSPAVLQSLVRLLAQDIRHDRHTEAQEEQASPLHDEVPLDIQTAYHIVDAYARSRPWSARAQADYFALASAYFQLGRRDEALRVMTAMLDLRAESQASKLQRPQIDDLRLLMEGLADIDLEKAIVIVISRTSPEGEDERDMRLLTQMLYRCWSMQRFDLTCMLLNFAEARGVSQRFFVEAIQTIVAFSAARLGGSALAMLSGTTRTYAVQLREDREASLSVAMKLEQLALDGLWRPSKPLLSAVIKLCVQETGPELPAQKEEEEGQEQDTQEDSVDNVEKGAQLDEVKDEAESRASGGRRHSMQAQDRQAALLLLHLSMRTLSTVDVSASRDVIRAIHQRAHAVASQPSSAMYGNAREFASLQAELDDVVHLLRQTWIGTSSQVAAPRGEEASTESVDGHRDEGSSTGYTMPVVLFRELMLAYVRLGDDCGAAQVLCWAREEAGVTLQALERTWISRRASSGEMDQQEQQQQQQTTTTSSSFAGFVRYAIGNGRRLKKGLRRYESSADVMDWLADRQRVPRTKTWWRAGEA